MSLPAKGWKGHGKPGYVCEAMEAVQRLHAATRAARCKAYALHDIAQSRAMPGPLPAEGVEQRVADEVALALETIALEGRR